MHRLSRVQLFILLDAYGQIPEPSAQLKEVLDALDEQRDHPNHSDDLVETIAKILASPKNKAALNSTFLDTIRAAILSPRELARLKAMMDTYQTCKGCGKELGNGEIASLHQQEPFCYSCIIPQTLRCPKCNELKEMPTGIHRVVTKAIKECKSCAAPAATGIVDEDADPTADVRAIQARRILEAVTPMGTGAGNPFDVETPVDGWRVGTMPTAQPPPMPATPPPFVIRQPTRNWVRDEFARDAERQLRARERATEIQRGDGTAGGGGR